MARNLIGERLKERRLACGLTQKTLADALGKSESAVRMWELGKNEPDIETITAVAKSLNTAPEYFTGWTDDPVNYADNEFVADAYSPLYLHLLEKYDGDSASAGHAYLLAKQAEEEDARADSKAGLADDRLIASYGEIKEHLSDDDIDDIELFMRMKAERKKKKESEKNNVEGVERH